jgi:hypothetical protein
MKSRLCGTALTASDLDCRDGTTGYILHDGPFKGALTRMTNLGFMGRKTQLSTVRSRRAA